MILTQAQIPYEVTARTWKDDGFRDSYAWHKRIWEAFPRQPEVKRNFLTRLDDVGEGFRLLVLSEELPTRPDWCPVDSWQSRRVPDRFFQHTFYRFSLLANPTRKKNGQRIALRKREDLIRWMERKAVFHGFMVETDSLKTIPRPRQQFLKKKKVGTHTATEFTGMLYVTDLNKFYTAATKGIGTARAFGFGMLCLVPIQKNG